MSGRDVRVRLLRPVVMGREFAAGEVVVVDADTAQVWVLDGTAVAVDAARMEEQATLKRIEQATERR